MFAEGIGPEEGVLPAEHYLYHGKQKEAVIRSELVSHQSR
jgi:hypothetical protein